MVAREHKDSLFRYVLECKREFLLDLYNALNGSDYTNPDELIVNTLENVIFMGMKNDISFIIESTLNLYEAQSTYNPNMPLRGLFYLSALLRGIVKDKNIFGKKLIKIPTPTYIVFYNGLEKKEDRIEQKLSDAFEVPTDDPCLECKALILNINYDHNRKLLERCEFLSGYSTFIKKFREYAKTVSEEEAANKAIDECIKEGNPLADILAKNRAEVYDMILSEYDEEKTLASYKEEGIEIGREEGIEEGIEIGREEGIEIGVGKGRDEGCDMVIAYLEQGYTIEQIKALRASGALIVAEHSPKKS